MKEHKIILIPLKISELREEHIGQPISHIQKTDKEYGIITGYTNNSIFVHFNNGDDSFMLKQEKHLFLIKTKTEAQ